MACLTDLKPPGHVVVEGPIGVGKTSLAKRLAESFGSDILLENAEENPFLVLVRSRDGACGAGSGSL